MSAETNRELLQKRLEIWSSGDTSGAEELFSEEYVMHGPNGDEYGVESFKRIVSNFHKELDGLEVHYEHVAVDEEKIAYVWKITGAHRVNGSPQTLRLSGVILLHIEEGKFVEEWRSSDAVSLLVELGLIEAGKGPERMYPRGEFRPEAGAR